jgi:hypothetical protein
MDIMHQCAKRNKLYANIKTFGKELIWILRIINVNAMLNEYCIFYIEIVLYFINKI